MWKLPPNSISRPRPFPQGASTTVAILEGLVPGSGTPAMDQQPGDQPTGRRGNNAKAKEIFGFLQSKTFSKDREGFIMGDVFADGVVRSPLPLY